jgi:polyisoprenoid-binding protein YceI
MSWQIDPAHTHIFFTGRHMMLTKVRGRFNEFDGIVNFDESKPENSRVDFDIEAASITTGDERRDNHLRSADFLDVENYPLIRFKSQRVEQVDEDGGRLIGDLTIRDVTRQVALDVYYGGQARTPWGTTSAGFSASATINRKDWGLTWNQALETGGVLVGEKINIEIELELVKQPEAELALA